MSLPWIVAAIGIPAAFIIGVLVGFLIAGLAIVDHDMIDDRG